MFFKQRSDVAGISTYSCGVKDFAAAVAGVAGDELSFPIVMLIDTHVHADDVTTNLGAAA
ncbi:hypothetical protein [Acidithiobacillus marinus]|nr:hypothetical protein [Acidithiobacillus marinus]